MVGDGPYGLAYRRYMETLFTGYKKITANGLVRRGRPEGVPLVRFDHILFKHNGRLLRATSHEPRPLPQAEGYSRRCIRFEFVAAQRHLSPRRPADCDPRPAGRQAPKFDERRTTYDERPFPRPPGPNINVSLNFLDLVQKRLKND